MSHKKRKLPSTSHRSRAAGHRDFESVRKAVDLLAGQRVLVIGDVGLDRYTFGRAERISPEAPVPIVAVQDERHKLGLAANVSDNIHALGSRSDTVGVVGQDAAAQLFRELLHQVGCSVQGLVTDSGRRTILKERVVSDGQQLLRIDYETDGEVSAVTRKQILARTRALLPSAQAVILQDYAKGLLSRDMVHIIVKWASARRIPVLLDPNAKTPLEFYSGTGGLTGLTPNTKEAEALSGMKITDLASCEAAGRRILVQTGAKFVLITRGKDGMALLEAGNPKVRAIPTTAREVYDVSGAGDTVISVLALALAARVELFDAAALANVAAGVEVGKRGTATVSRTEIKLALDQLMRAPSAETTRADR